MPGLEIAEITDEKQVATAEQDTIAGGASSDTTDSTASPDKEEQGAGDSAGTELSDGEQAETQTEDETQTEQQTEDELPETAESKTKPRTERRKEKIAGEIHDLLGTRARLKSEIEGMIRQSGLATKTETPSEPSPLQKKYQEAIAAYNKASQEGADQNTLGRLFFETDTIKGELIEENAIRKAEERMLRRDTQMRVANRVSDELITLNDKFPFLTTNQQGQPVYDPKSSLIQNAAASARKAGLDFVASDIGNQLYWLKSAALDLALSGGQVAAAETKKAVNQAKAVAAKTGVSTGTRSTTNTGQSTSREAQLRKASNAGDMEATRELMRLQIERRMAAAA